MPDIAVDISGAGSTDLNALRRSIIGEGFTSSQADKIVADIAGKSGGKVASPSSVSHSQTSSQKVYPPGLEGNLASSMDKLHAMQAQMNPLMDALLGETQATGMATITAINKGAEAQGLLYATEAEKQARQLAVDEKLASVFNNDINNPDSVVIDQLARWDQANRAVQEQRPAIDHLTSINPIADPVRWLFAQIQLSSAVPQYNAAVTKREAASQEIATRNQLQASQRSLTPAITLDNIRQEALAKTNLAAAQAVINSAKVKEATINMTMQIGQDKLRMAGLDVSTDMEMMRLYMAKMGFSAQDSLKEDQQFELDRANQVLTTYGAPPVHSYRELKMLPKPVQDILSSANPNLASPSQAIIAIKELDTIRAIRANSSAAAQVISDILQEAEQVRKKDKNAQFDKRPENAKLQDDIDAVVKQWTAENRKAEMNNASSKNPYKMKATAYAKAPSLANNPIAQFVNTEGQNMPQLGEKEILSYGIAQIKNGVPADKVVADTVEFFREGGKFQYDTQHLGVLGFDPLEYNGVQKYPIGQNLYGTWDQLLRNKPALDRPVDALDPVSVKHFYVSTISQKASSTNPVGFPLLSTIAGKDGQ